MSRLWARLAGLFSNKTFLGMDKTGNRYFARHEQIDGIMKEKRWVVFKGEQDPTSVPVEWISWLNGQRKRAPTPEEMDELEARRERVKLNVALLKKEEEERKVKESKAKTIGRAAGPDLKSFIQQFPTDSEVIKAPKNLRNRNKSQNTSENSRQSLRSQLDLVNPSDLGHGNRQHDSAITMSRTLLQTFYLDTQLLFFTTITPFLSDSFNYDQFWWFDFYCVSCC